MQQPGEETAHIISQVATLEGKISELNKERTKLLQRLNHIRSPTISRIPPEILSRIFRFAALPCDTTSRLFELHGPSLSDTAALLKICAVCFHWRRVTQSSPQLWTTLAVAGKSSYSRTRTTDYVGLMLHYYQLLGGAAMSLYISKLDGLEDTIINEIIRVATEDYPGKLRLLHLKGCTNASGWSALLKHAAKNTEFTRLEELNLEWKPCEKQPSSQEGTIFRNSPRLHKLSLDGKGGRQIPLEFPWRQITELKLYNTSYKYSFQLLTLCPNLIHFEFSTADDNGADKPWIPQQRQITSMQFLRRLTWHIMGHDDLGRAKPKPVDPQFFEYFRFPAIRKLDWYAPLPSDATPIHDLFANMQELEELKTQLSQWQYCINQHLSAFNNLVILNVELIGEEEEMLQWIWRLTVKQDKDNVLPHLQRIHLEIDDFPPHGLIVLLYSRRNGPVDWSDPEQDPEDLVLPPYDPTSVHWQYYTRLLEFVSNPNDYQVVMDWTWSPHYDAMKAMMSEAKEVEGFGELDSEKSRILF